MRRAAQDSDLEGLQNRHQQLEVLEAVQVFFFDLGFSLPRHTLSVCAVKA